MGTDLFFRAVDKARLLEVSGGLPEVLTARVKMVTATYFLRRGREACSTAPPGAPAKLGLAKK